MQDTVAQVRPTLQSHARVRRGEGTHSGKGSVYFEKVLKVRDIVLIAI